ncbi:four helix bundle protein [Psychroflexus sediminis]
MKTAKKFEMLSRLYKSGTSAGAKIKETQNAESKANFIHKLKTAVKEAYLLQRNHKIKKISNR